LFTFISIWKYKIIAVLRTFVYTILVLLGWRDLVLRITLIKTLKILKIPIFKNISHIHFPINKIPMFTTLTVILLIKILKKLVIDFNGRIQIEINNISVLWCILCKLRWLGTLTVDHQFWSWGLRILVSGTLLETYCLFRQAQSWVFMVSWRLFVMHFYFLFQLYFLTI
jgi:hypothetical protein